VFARKSPPNCALATRSTKKKSKNSALAFTVTCLRPGSTSSMSIENH